MVILFLIACSSGNTELALKVGLPIFTGLAIGTFAVWHENKIDKELEEMKYTNPEKYRRIQKSLSDIDKQKRRLGW